VDSKLWLIMGELSASVGSKEMASTLIRKLTELYSNTDEQVDVTRTHGEETFKGCVINWLVGTTPDWLRDVVDSTMVDGGFFGRVCTVVGKEDLSVRIPVPIYPRDADKLFAALQAHLAKVEACQGEMVFEAKAEEMITTWYKHRPAPNDKGQVALWRRQPALLRKLAIVCSLARGTSRVITMDDAVLARQLTGECARNHPAIADYVRSGPTTDKGRQLLAWIRGSGKVSHVDLSKRAMKMWLSLFEFQQQVHFWLDAQEISRSGGPGKGVYTYIGKRKMPVVKDEEPDG